MTRRRWIADEFSENRAALTGQHADHLARVLRARTGQEFDIAAGDKVRRGRVVAVSAGRVEFQLGEDLPSAVAPSLTLVLSIFKFDRVEWAIEKCTELGVARILPLIARRTDSHLASAAGKRVERWRRIALQASEQSRRANPPEIADPIQLREALSISAESKIVVSEVEEGLHLGAVVSSQEGEVLLAIGPEGGWTEGELGQFEKAGWTSASLGSSILRSETAAIAAVAISMACLSR